MKEKKHLKEKIKELLTENPYLSNREIGKLLNLSRGAIQWHIKSLGIHRDRKTLQKYNNTVRSKEIEISESAEQIILGSILGDGSITKWVRGTDSKRNLNSHLVISHTEPQLEYLLYKKHLLENARIKCQKVIKITKERLTKLCPEICGRSYTVKDRYTLATRRAITFNKYRDMFYKKVKYVNRYIYKLKALGLAIWFMDDGTKLHNTYSLSTQCFDLKSLRLLQKVLFHNFNLDTTLNKARTNQYNIYIKRKCADLFKQIIFPFICDSMKYKLYT